MAWASTIDFATVITGIGAVAAALAGVYVVVKGAKIGLSFLRG